MSTSPNGIGSSPEDNGRPRVLDLYDASGLLGSVAIGRSIRAIRPNGSEIGTFDTVEAARRAVVLSADTSIGK